MTTTDQGKRTLFDKPKKWWEQKKKNYNSKPMTLKREIIRLALPFAIQSLLSAMISLVDNLSIGNLPTSAQESAAALNAVANVNFIFSSIITGFIAGIGIYFMQAGGKADIEKQKELFKTKMVWTLMLAGFFMTIATVFIKPIAGLWVSKTDAGVINMETYNKTLDIAQRYALWVFPTSLLSYICTVYSSSFKELRQVGVTVAVAMFSIALNAGLNYPLIYVVGWGAEGSAIATAIVNFCAFTFWMIYVWRKKPNFIPRYREMFKITWNRLFAIFPKSFWWMVNSVVFSLYFTIQMMFISKMSNQAGASLNAAGVFAQLFTAFVSGYSSAVSLIVTTKIGINTPKEVKHICRKLVQYSLLVGFGFGVLLSGASFGLNWLYPYNDQTREVAHFINSQSQLMLFCIAARMVPDLLLSVYLSALRGGGYAKSLILLDSSIGWIISLPLTILLIQFTDLTYGWVYLITLSSMYLKTPIIYIFYLKKIDTIKPLNMNAPVMIFGSRKKNKALEK